MNQKWPKHTILARWKCGHELKTTVYEDTRGNGLPDCPYCTLVRIVASAPIPATPLQKGEDYLAALERLSMYYGEWYENEIMPLLKQESPAGAGP